MQIYLRMILMFSDLFDMDEVYTLIGRLCLFSVNRHFRRSTCLQIFAHIYTSVCAGEFSQNYSLEYYYSSLKFLQAISKLEKRQAPVRRMSRIG